MSRTKTIRKRNPIARVVRHLGYRVVGDKREAERMRVLDELEAEVDQLGEEE